jgi:propanol-preferring alcohol dehydrogenase
MLAVQILAYGQSFHLMTAAPEPEPGPCEVLVRVRASGLCSTDLHLLGGRQPLGRLPRIPGHETAGDVVALGPDVEDGWLGRRVIVAIDVVCGRCRHCLTGQTQRCQQKQRIGFERDGGHADLVVVPVPNLVLLPDGVSYEEGAILPDAVACMYHSLIAQGELGPGQRAVILGVGGLGIHGVQIARLAGAEVLGTSRQTARLEAARAYGALAVNPSEVSLAGFVADWTEGEGADVVADCIGTRASVAEALGLLRPGGRLLVIAYADETFEIPSIPLFAAERTIVGCRGATLQELHEVTRMVAQRKLQAVIGARYPLVEIAEAARRLEDGAVVGRTVLTR